MVMPGLDPGIHALLAALLSWMAGTSPAMTIFGFARVIFQDSLHRSRERVFRPEVSSFLSVPPE
jgi:hypothetical protein